jgi:hypothetical protein
MNVPDLHRHEDDFSSGYINKDAVHMIIFFSLVICMTSVSPLNSVIVLVSPNRS